jgi:hypothetical protein
MHSIPEPYDTAISSPAQFLFEIKFDFIDHNIEITGSGPGMNRGVDPLAIGVAVIVPVTACRGGGQQAEH